MRLPPQITELSPTNFIVTFDFTQDQLQVPHVLTCLTRVKRQIKRGHPVNTLSAFSAQWANPRYLTLKLSFSS